MDNHEAGFSNDVIQNLIRGNTVDVIEAHSQEYQQERRPIAGSDNMEALEKFLLQDFLTGDDKYHADGIRKMTPKNT